MPIGRKRPPQPKARVQKNTRGKGSAKKSKEEKAEISRQNGKKSPKKAPEERVYPEGELITLPDYGVEDMYADIYDPRAKIEPEIKIHAAACYFLTGNVKAAARMAGLSHQTISNWKNHAQWWTPVISKIRKEKNDELDAEITELIHLSIGGLADRVQNGEEVYTKDGFVKKEMSGRDLAQTINILYDKRTMLRGDPTSIKAVQDPKKLLDELRDEFRTMARTEAKRELNMTVVNNDTQRET